MKVADVDTVLPEWVGLEVEVISTFENVWGHKYFEVEFPLKDNRIMVILSEHQIETPIRG